QLQAFLSKWKSVVVSYAPWLYRESDAIESLPLQQVMLFVGRALDEVEKIRTRPYPPFETTAYEDLPREVVSAYSDLRAAIQSFESRLTTGARMAKSLLVVKPLLLNRIVPRQEIAEVMDIEDSDL